MTGRARVELGEDGLLDLHPLRDRLDDEVDVAERLIRRRARDQAEDLLDLRGALLLGQLALLDELADLSLGDRARLGEARLDEVLADVLEDDRNAGGGDRLRDLTTHGAGADDGGLEHEHGADLLLG